ncbi:MAG: ATP-binding protein [Carnobacterium inhibens]|uniref:ATP-binding protein n=1 Tax=Carnobacterium inhibens TaxID=147709 RepID=UPI0033151427
MRSMAEVMAELQKRAEQFSTEEPDGLDQQNHICQKCKDKGGTFEKKTDDETGITSGNTYDVWIECTCKKTRKINRLMKSSEITDSFKKMGFSNFEIEGKLPVIKDSRDCAVAYFKDYESLKDERSNSIALLGQPGAGKTHLLTAIANNFIQKKAMAVLYFPYVEGFNDLRDNFERLEEKLGRMKEVEVLFIDDLFKPVNGKPQATEWELKQLFSVINFRYLNHKPLLISSELDIDSMLNLDEALATRIAEMCQNYMVVIKGDKRQLNYRIRNFRR